MKEVHVDVKELARDVDRYINLVKMGDVIVITESGLPIGRIVPAGSAERDVKRVITALLETGKIEWDGQRFRPTMPRVANKGDKTASDVVSEDRNVEYIS